MLSSATWIFTSACLARRLSSSDEADWASGSGCVQRAGSGGDRVRISRLNQPVHRFLVHALGFRRGQRLVQFIQFRRGDVLFFVDAQNFVLFLVAHQFFLRRFHFHLQIHQLFREPVGGLHGGIEARFEIVLRIRAHQGIDHDGGQVFVGAAEATLMM